MRIVLSSNNRDVVINSKDEHYKTFLGAIQETAVSSNEPMPKLITIPDYVMDQWDFWMELKQMFRDGTKTFKMNMLKHVLVRMADVEVLLGYLVDLPDGWTQYVYFDERTPVEQRKKYYSMTGNYQRRHKKKYFVDHLLPHSRDWLEYTDPYAYAVTEEQTINCLNVDWLNVARRSDHNRRLIKLVYGEEEMCDEVVVDIPDIFWSFRSNAIDLISQDRMKEACDILYNNVSNFHTVMEWKNIPKQEEVIAPIRSNNCIIECIREVRQWRGDGQCALATMLLTIIIGIILLLITLIERII